MPSARYVGRGALFGYGPKVQVQTVTSTGTTLNNHGVVSFGATGAKTWSLKAPVAGQFLVLYCNDGATGAIQKVSISTANGAPGFVTTGGAKKVAQFNKDHEVLHCVGLSTVQYLVVAPNASIAYSTS